MGIERSRRQEVKSASGARASASEPLTERAIAETLQRATEAPLSFCVTSAAESGGGSRGVLKCGGASTSLSQRTAARLVAAVSSNACGRVVHRIEAAGVWSALAEELPLAVIGTSERLTAAATVAVGGASPGAGAAGIVFDPSAASRAAIDRQLASLVPMFSALIALRDEITSDPFEALDGEPFEPPVYVVSVARGCVVWTTGDVVAWEHAPAVVELVERLGPSAERFGAIQVTLSTGRVRVVDLGWPKEFGRERCIAVKPLERTPAAAAGPKLSRRERETADLLVTGDAAIEIAAKLRLSEHTVRRYVRRIYAKLGVCNRADLVRQLLGMSIHDRVGETAGSDR